MKIKGKEGGRLKVKKEVEKRIKKSTELEKEKYVNVKEKQVEREEK